MGEQAIRIAVGSNRSVTGIWSEPASAPRSGGTVIYAPGAGATIADGFGRFAANALAEANIASLRFQFLYTEEQRRLPDRPEVLERLGARQ